MFKVLIENTRKTLHKKWSFPLRISSVNVTKFAGNCRFGRIYWRNPWWETSFFVHWKLSNKFKVNNKSEVLYCDLLWFYDIWDPGNFDLKTLFPSDVCVFMLSCSRLFGINPYLANVPKLYPLKTTENVRFSGVSRGIKREYWSEDNRFSGVSRGIKLECWSKMG